MVSADAAMSVGANCANGIVPPALVTSVAVGSATDGAVGSVLNAIEDGALMLTVSV